MPLRCANIREAGGRRCQAQQQRESCASESVYHGLISPGILPHDETLVNFRRAKEQIYSLTFCTFFSLPDLLSLMLSASGFCCMQKEVQMSANPKYTPGTPEYRENRRLLVNAWNHANPDKAKAIQRRQSEKRKAERAAARKGGEANEF